MKNTLLCFIFMILPVIALAHDPDAGVSDSLFVRAARLEESIVVDGLLAEKVWQNGNGVTQFTQRDPNEGSRPTENTEVRVAYDESAIYIGARMYDSAADSIIAQLARRDAFTNSDLFIVFIDPYYDRRSGYYFALTAAGALLDGVLMNDDWDDDSWDGVWEGKTHIDAQGWSAEFRVPYSQLRFHQKEQYLWSINFRRDIQRKNERDYLVFTPKDGSGFVSRFVDLVGIEHIEPIRQIEVSPYFRTKAEFTHAEPGDPFNDGSRFLPGAGADIKIGIGNNLTLDATVNPDFGQVEVDPAVVNLSDIETFYDEKRPFFIEGSSIFSFGRGGSSSFYSLNWSEPDFFYTRRIGRAPQGSLPESFDYADVPEGARILGAGKLSGKIGTSWNVGTLHAVTAREQAELSLGNERFFSEVEPITYYGVLRAQKEFEQGRRGLGFLSTLTQRKFENEALRAEMNDGSEVFGVDGWTFLDKEKVWVITGWAGVTHLRGSQERLIGLQRSASHYFQKPGVSYVAVDSAATSMTGYAGRFWINKQKGNVILNFAFGFLNPKFNVNDLGFYWRNDVVNGHLIAGYKWVKPGKIFRRAEVHLSPFTSYDFGGNRSWCGIFQFGDLNFLNYYSFDWFWAYNPETVNSRLTRGGPLTLNPAGWEAQGNIVSDDRKPIVIEMSLSGGNYASAKYWGVSAGVEWKPATNVLFVIGPNFTWERTTAQYLTTVEDPTAIETYGARYVFGQLDQTTLSASIRLNWTFTPKLSLQLYAQPFISSGDYYDFKELARPKSYDFTIYGQGKSTFDEENDMADPDGSGPAPAFEINNPDFNYKSLRGNAVLRWEYQPGSTLYLVWTQSRENYEEMGDFRFTNSMRRLWRADVDNIFMIKMSYWLGL